MYSSVENFALLEEIAASLSTDKTRMILVLWESRWLQLGRLRISLR